MGIFSDIRNRLGYVDWQGLSAIEPTHAMNGAAPPEAKGIPQLVGGSSRDFGLVWLGQGRAEPDEMTRATAYALSVYCYAAMQYRATKIAEPPLWVAAETEDGEEWLRDHLLIQVLERPNPDMDMGAMLMATSFFLDMDGEALWVQGRNAGERVVQLYPFSRDSFEPHYGPDRLYQAFAVQHGGGTTRYEAEDVVYWREPSPHLTHRPASRMDAALRWANMGRHVEEGIKDALRHGVMPFTIFNYPSDYTPDPETRDRNKETLQARHGSAQNRGTPMALYGGLTAQFAEADLNRLLPSEIMDRAEANVALAFGMRPEVLGYLVGLRNSPWSHMDTARRITYEDVIEPVWRRIEKTLTRQLLPEQDQALRRFIRVDTSGIRALQDDEFQKAKISSRNADIWTRDERRVFTGKEPLNDERGAEIVGNAGQAERSPQEQMAARSMWETKDAGTRNILWAEFDLSAKAQESVWEPEVAKLLARQSKDVQRLFDRWVKEAGGTPTPDSLSRFLAEVGQFLGAEGADAARRTLEPLVRATSTQASRRLTARLGFGFDVVQAGLEKYIAEETGFLVSVMGETTGRAVAETVQGSLTDRIPMRDLRERLQGLPEFDRRRAQLVARTETTRATNGAQRRTAQEYERETGRSMQKSWISARDDRVRDEHIDLDDGEWYAVDHEWPNGLASPGEPNCRCTLLYRLSPEVT